MGLRAYIDNYYIRGHQEDPSEFLLSLLEKFDTIKLLLTFGMLELIKCNECNDNIEHLGDMSILPLSLSPIYKNKTYSHQQIIDLNIGTLKNVEGNCRNCHSESLKNVTSIVSPGSVLIMVLKLYKISHFYNKTKDEYTSYAEKIKNLRILNVEKTILNISGKKYYVNSVINHLGNNVNSGHYTCTLRNESKSWMLANDLIVRSAKYPKHSNNVYMFFLEECT